MKPFEYTPTTEEVRASYVLPGLARVGDDAAAFDRWRARDHQDLRNEISERIRRLIDQEWEDTQDVDGPIYVALLAALDAVDPGQTRVEWDA